MWSPNELLKTEKQRDILSYITLQFFPFKKVPLEHYPKHTGSILFAALKGNTGRFSTQIATQKGDCREAIAFLRGNMKQEKHEIRCSEIEKHLGKCRFFEKSYKNTRTKGEFL